MRKMTFILLILVLASCWQTGEEYKVDGSSMSQQFIGLREDRLCDGNRFLFYSTYQRGRQKELTLTIA